MTRGLSGINSSLGNAPGSRQVRARARIRARAGISDPFQGVEAPGRQGAEERAYGEYVSDEQRSRTGCIGGLNGSLIPARVLTKYPPAKPGALDGGDAPPTYRGARRDLAPPTAGAGGREGIGGTRLEAGGGDTPHHGTSASRRSARAGSPSRCWRGSPWGSASFQSRNRHTPGCLPGKAGGGHPRLH